MAVNRFQRHLLILPEDDANRQIANGFLLRVKSVRDVQVLNVARGWRKAWDSVKSQHLSDLKLYSEAHFVLLIDFDGQEDRARNLMKEVPEELRSRLFIIGALTEPEELKELGHFESIGVQMIDACTNQDCESSIWSHELLKHNADEIARAKEAMGAWLLDC